MTILLLTNHFNKYNPLYRTYGDYYNGKHKNLFKDFGKENPNHKELEALIKDLKDNMCKIVVDSITARLQLDGFQIDNEETQGWCDDYFAKERVTGIAKAVHRDTVIYGDSYVLVWVNDKGKPVLSHERPYNMAVKYDINGYIEYAIKWIIERLSDTKTKSHFWLYTNDAIYKFSYDGQTIPSTFNWLQLDYEIQNPFKQIPVFHFYNGIRKDAFCRSDLGDVVPLQIALNKEIQSREMASDFNAFKQKYVIGDTIAVGPDGKPEAPFKSSVDNIWVFTNPETKVGEFSTTDLGNYTATINDIREEISRVSRVPFHIMGLGGNFPSGEALKTAEAPLIAKIKDKQLFFGDIWEDVFRFLCEIAKKPCETIQALWTDMTPHSELEQWQIALLKKDAGVSSNQILIEQGYTQDEIDEFNRIKAEQSQMAFNAFNGVGNFDDKQNEN